MTKDVFNRIGCLQRVVLFLLFYDRIMDMKLIRFLQTYCRAVAVIGQYGGRARKG